MLLLGIDLGTSSVKVSVVDAATQRCIASASFPETEAEIIADRPGRAEQRPEDWWTHVQQAILKCNAAGGYDPTDIGAIGIAYQMHGLVIVDRDLNVLRNAIIWCDSRAVDIGERTYNAIGSAYCLKHLLNSPGNFTASKLAWVRDNEPDIFEKIHKVMLPGDYIAMRMTGDCTTTITAMSEGVFWDFKGWKISRKLIHYLGFDFSIFPGVHDVFAPHGYLSASVAGALGLKTGVPITYKAGDQPNNAFSLNVLQPGEVAATAGTSGVIYGVTDQLCYDPHGRINSFAHVNHVINRNRIGQLLCINGTGCFNRWMRNLLGERVSYAMMNDMAASVQSDGLLAMPFGNGAERMLHNEVISAAFHGLDFNRHSAAHLVRAVQEGIAFAFRYGLDIMRDNGIAPTVIRAGRTNLFLSDVFAQSFADVNDVALEFYEGDGSYGAALGARRGAKVKGEIKRQAVQMLEPSASQKIFENYENWKLCLQNILKESPTFPMKEAKATIL